MNVRLTSQSTRSRFSLAVALAASLFAVRVHAQEPAPAAPPPAAPAPVQYAPPPAPTQYAAPPPTQYAAPNGQPLQHVALPGAALEPQRRRGRNEVPVPLALGVSGSVVDVGDLTATISVGSRDGLTLGTPIMFINTTEQLDVFAGEKEPQVVGEVVKLTEDRALVALGLLEKVAVGQRVEVRAERVTGHRAAPPRPDSTVIIEGGVRPFLPIRRVSIGAVADLAITYLPPFPMFFRAELLPAVGRVGAGSDMGSMGGLFSLGYDQRFVSVGLGAGAVQHRDFAQVSEYDYALTDRSARFQLAQIVRVGARDGLHVGVRSAFALTDERWRLSTLTFSGQIPLSVRAAIAPRFLVGPYAGLFTGEVGVRMLVHGDGGPDSVFVRPVAGFVGTYDGDDNRGYYGQDIGAALDNMLFGPMLGVDVEWRI